MEDLASGEIWLGYDAFDLSLVDHIMMSNEYIGEWISKCGWCFKAGSTVLTPLPNN